MKRFAVFCKIPSGEFVNYYANGRTYSNKKYPQEKAQIIRKYYGTECEVREVEVITDTEMLEWFIKRSQLAVRHPDGGLCTLNSVPNPREYIANAMKGNV